MKLLVPMSSKVLFGGRLTISVKGFLVALVGFDGAGSGVDWGMIEKA